MNGATPGERLYHRWCGSSTTDRARYYDSMNPADKTAWEALAAGIADDVRAAGRRTNALELFLPSSAPGASLLVRPTDRIKHVARAVARLCRIEVDEMQRWTLESLGAGWEDAADGDARVAVALDRELTVNEAGLANGTVVCARAL